MLYAINIFGECFLLGYQKKWTQEYFVAFFLFFGKELPIFEGEKMENLRKVTISRHNFGLGFSHHIASIYYF
jgi:hypothetical protein